MDNFLPEMSEGDYDFTLKKFQQVLREQHNQPLHKQNSEVSDGMMRKIFPYRLKRKRLRCPSFNKFNTKEMSLSI